jgi:hypothetical protein
MNSDSFSLGARHLFQNKNLRISKKYFDSLTLKHFEFYVNLVRHFVDYLQPFNLVYG